MQDGKTGDLNLDHFERLCEIMKEHKVSELRTCNLSVKMDQGESLPLNFPAAAMKGPEVSDEDILMDPFAGLNEGTDE